MKRPALAAAVLIVPFLLAACGQQTSSGFSVPTIYKMVLQDGTEEPGALTGDDFKLWIILRPQAGIAQRVASGSLTLQGKTFSGGVNTGADTRAQPGDVGPISVQLCRDVRNGQNIGVELNFYDAGGALLGQGHATIRKISNSNYGC